MCLGKVLTSLARRISFAVFTCGVSLRRMAALGSPSKRVRLAWRACIYCTQYRGLSLRVSVCVPACVCVSLSLSLSLCLYVSVRLRVTHVYTGRGRYLDGSPILITTPNAVSVLDSFFLCSGVNESATLWPQIIIDPKWTGGAVSVQCTRHMQCMLICMQYH